MDRDLVERAQRNDRDAFAILARSHGDRLMAIAQRILRDVGRAEDAVQQTLVIAWGALPSLRDPDRFDAWLQRLLVNACYWAVGLENTIPAKANVDYVGEYKPLWFGFGKFKPGVKPADLEQKYEDIKARIEALGPVNPQALEEYQEAQQRYDFLNAQRQDLLDSIRDTETAIHDIDVETRRRFSEAFEAINANFREMFQVLFGGGAGEMRLTDEANIGESGIEMVASPPGKRLQNVLLLSGGEKALTALALLMGIFKYQPSPFCIFDEVDAPLDEPNIQRLMRLLMQMSAQTQFIIITHAKRTMEAADALYGVTMQEPGVSKLVSVRLSDRTREAAAA